MNSRPTMSLARSTIFSSESMFPSASLVGIYAARHTNLRQHLRGHPALEGLRLRQLGRKNQRIESRLVDENDLTLLT